MEMFILVGGTSQWQPLYSYCDCITPIDLEFQASYKNDKCWLFRGF